MCIQSTKINEMHNMEFKTENVRRPLYCAAEKSILVGLSTYLKKNKTFIIKLFNYRNRCCFVLYQKVCVCKSNVSLYCVNNCAV